MTVSSGDQRIEINGGNVVYEILGTAQDSADTVVLTPGGRFSKDIPGLRPLAEKLVEGGYRVVLWDRPNCGKSDVVRLQCRAAREILLAQRRRPVRHHAAGDGAVTNRSAR